MFRIGEFSKLTQISIRMLRYYDEVGLNQHGADEVENLQVCCYLFLASVKFYSDNGK